MTEKGHLKPLWQLIPAYGWNKPFEMFGCIVLERGVQVIVGAILEWEKCL